MCKDFKVDCLNCIEYSILIVNEIELCNECYWMKELKEFMAFVRSLNCVQCGIGLFYFTHGKYKDKKVLVWMLMYGWINGLCYWS